MAPANVKTSREKATGPAQSVTFCVWILVRIRYIRYTQVERSAELSAVVCIASDALYTSKFSRHANRTDFVHTIFGKKKKPRYLAPHTCYVCDPATARAAAASTNYRQYGQKKNNL